MKLMLALLFLMPLLAWQPSSFAQHGGGSEVGNAGDPFSALFSEESKRAYRIMDRTSPEELSSYGLEPKLIRLYSEKRIDWMRVLAVPVFELVPIDLWEVNSAGVNELKAGLYNTDRKIVQISSLFFQQFRVTQAQVMVLAVHEFGHQLGIKGKDSHQNLSRIGEALLSRGRDLGETFGDSSGLDQSAPQTAKKESVADTYTFMANLLYMDNCPKRLSPLSGAHFYSVGDIPASLRFMCYGRGMVLNAAEVTLKVPAGARGKVRLVSSVPFKTLKDCNNMIRFLNASNGYISHGWNNNRLDLACEMERPERTFFVVTAHLFDGPAYQDQ
ncbi:MAG TPA: hypothetical protein VHV83_06400 [Armatimonadota bacterium]|nr:hypothetical protein [Armatimonadota bacterium]